MSTHDKTAQRLSNRGHPIDAESAAPMSYAQLLEHGGTYLAESGLGRQQVRNLLSALRLWVNLLGFSLTRLVAEDFGPGFDANFQRFCDLMNSRLAQRTQRDRQEQLLRWRRIVDALRVRDTLPESFGEALRQCLAASPLPLTHIARTVSIAATTLSDWTKGAQLPKGPTASKIPHLEAVLELPKNTLVSRLPLARRAARYSRNAPTDPAQTAFTRIRQKQMADAYRYAISFTPRLAAQWQSLLRLKTDPLREGALARNTWRLKPLEKVSMNVTEPMMFDGQVCPTAGVQWGMFASYLGWLRLPRPQGDGKPPHEADTLAWLADARCVIAYAKWMMRRSEGRFHNGVNVFLQLCESHLRPETGFIWLSADLEESIPELDLRSANPDVSKTPWQSHCERARHAIRAFRRKAEGTMAIRKSRDPEERAEVALNDAFPLRVLVQFVERLENSPPPPAHKRDYIVWIRDVTLCRLLISNPLRIGQVCAMTYRADGAGNLARVGPGRFRLRFKPSDFKNEKGAASGPYDVEVDSSVVPWIERYLVEARPYLVDADRTDRFFLQAVAGPRKEKSVLKAAGLAQPAGFSGSGLLSRIKYLTRVYIDGCPGFGPQAFRHIIATDHLVRHPGDYLTVAVLLHDKLATVLKYYAHLKVNMGLKVLSEGIRQASSDLAEQRKRP